MNQPVILRVAVDAPLATPLDYLAPEDVAANLTPGVRVRVPFRRTNQVGVLLETASETALSQDRLRRAHAIVDDAPLFDQQLLDLIRWAASYYRHPVGEVFAAALPAALRRGSDADTVNQRWRLTDQGRTIDPKETAKRAPRQAEILAALSTHESGVDASAFRDSNTQATLRRMRANAWVEKIAVRTQATPLNEYATASGPELTAEQRDAFASITATDGFAAHLLFGVTGSGKTEVYLRAIEQQLQQDRQALVLVPEISLTPQLVQRFRKRFAAPIAVLHSGLPAGERLSGWCDARAGRAGVVIGTRSAIFVPLARPGLIVVDEEHDPSLKQQEGFRYSARDLAVVRAKRHGIPVVLGSATPSLESLRNVERARYQRLDLARRPGRGRNPDIRLIDLRVEPSHQGLSTELVQCTQRHLDAGGQVLMFLNRRGFAPAWFCSGCGYLAPCRRCDARMTFHQRSHRLRCHHCGHERPPEDECPQCNAELTPVGQGTERIEEQLAHTFPGVPVGRIDRDTTRKRGSLEDLLMRVARGDIKILIGTQMLTKGHHFPDVSLVGVLNADQGLFGTDFRSTERLAQTIVQVAGRAGRAERAGEVLIQTSFPEHPLLQRLIGEGYESFAVAALAERKSARWPPYSHLALIRARAHQRELPDTFLTRVKQMLQADGLRDVRCLGPAAAPMHKRAGFYNVHLLLQAGDRGALMRVLTGLPERIGQLPETRRVRWSLDVDPAELF